MDTFYYDILWSGITYVILTYLAFKLMRSKKSNNGSSDDGDQDLSIPPKIDLPPGIVWPKDLDKLKEEEVLV
ncbi:hypothetical protein [Roseivirga sp.]|uniref:hypothetical protein n=1 Tax=Roseivirga sp. TaxID=1964215 RepID=UPI003B8AAF48